MGKRKMTPKQKRILLVSGSVAVLLVVVVTALVLFISVNVYKPRSEAAASDAIGMDFKIGGTMRIVLFPRFGVSLGNVLIKKGHRGDNRNDFMGAHTSCAGLVLRSHIHGKFNLRFLRHSSGDPSQHRGSIINPFIRRSGYCRARAQDRRIDRGEPIRF